MYFQDEYPVQSDDCERCFCADDFDFNQLSYGDLLSCFSAVGHWYRSEKPRRPTGNIENIKNLLDNLFKWHKRNIDNGTIQKNYGFFPVKFSYVSEQYNGGISYFFWKQFLNFAERHGFLSLQHKTSNILWVKFNFQNLKQFIACCMNIFGSKVGGVFKILQKSEKRKANRTLTTISLPEWFSDEMTKSFEALLQIRYSNHKTVRESTQRKLAEDAEHLRNNGVDPLYALQRAVEKRWNWIYNPTKHDFDLKPQEHIKPKINDGFHKISQIFSAFRQNE